jgi:hypothetical protein
LETLETLKIRDENSCPLLESHSLPQLQPEKQSPDDVRAFKPCSLWRPRNSPMQKDTSGVGPDDEHV